MPKIVHDEHGYHTRLSLTDSLTGRRVQRRVSAPTKRKLDNEVARIRAEWNSGAWIEPDKTTLLSWLETWHSTYRASSASRYTRGRHIRGHIQPDELAKIPITRLRYSHAQDFVDRLILRGLAPNSVRAIVTTLSMALAQAVRRQLIPANPCTGLQLPTTGAKRWTVLDESQARRVVDATRDDPLHALWTLAITLGIRRGELLALNWSDIDLTAATLRIERTMTVSEGGRRIVGDAPKRDSSRRVLQLPSVCLDALRRHRARQNERRLAAGEAWDDSGAVFDQGMGERLSAAVFYRKFDALKQTCELPASLRPHDFRHTAATLMLSAGVPIPTVAKILGHGSPAVTMSTYLHVIRAMEDQATTRIDALFTARRVEG
jgi:integrase